MNARLEQKLDALIDLVALLIEVAADDSYSMEDAILLDSEVKEIKRRSKYIQPLDDDEDECYIGRTD